MTTTRSASYVVAPVSPVLGAEVVGIDLAGGVDEATAAALREDFWRHKVLVFRNQHLSPDAHVEAVRIFDEPFDHPLWLHRDPQNRLVYVFDLEQAGTRLAMARRRHLAQPTVQHRVAHLPGGARGRWAHAVGRSAGGLRRAIRAGQGASGVGQRRVQRLPGRRHIQSAAGDRDGRAPGGASHRHTGRKGLFLSSSAIRLTGIEPNEGEAILPFLLTHASSPNYTIGFGWKPGDFVIWDNQAAWHFAVNDYDGPRVYRKVIGG